MRSPRSVRSRRPGAALLALLLLAATGWVGGACSSSNGGGAGSGATLSAPQVTLVDGVISTTEGYLAQYAASPPVETTQLKPRALFGSETMSFLCPAGGDASITVSGSGPATGTAEAAITATFANCASSALRIDGKLSLSCAQSGTSVTDAINGAVAVITYASDGSVALQADVTFNDLSLSTSGGQETASGSITIGGTIYSPSNLDYLGAAPTACAAFFGGDAGTSSGGSGDGGGTITGAGACVVYVDDAGDVVDAGTAAECLVTSVNGTNTSGPPCNTGLTYAAACPSAQLVGCCTRHANSDSKTIVLEVDCDYTALGETAATLEQNCLTPFEDGGAPGSWSTSAPQ